MNYRYVGLIAANLAKIYLGYLEEKGLEMERVKTELSPVGEISSLFVGLLSLMTFPGECDAILIIPGLGEHWRTQDAIDRWEKGEARYLLVAGDNPAEKYRIELNLENLQRHFGLKRIKNVACQKSARHSRDQADWAAERIEELGVRSVMLCVSGYHILRATLTLVKSLQTAELSTVRINPKPASKSPFAMIPETGHPAWDSVELEIGRIGKYQAIGDVATLEEFKSYIERMN